MNELTQKELRKKWETYTTREKNRDDAGEKDKYQPDFSLLVSSLSLQAMIAMGKVKSPITGRKEENFKQARFLIDTLPVLREKTRGNLSKEEGNLLEEVIFHLRNNYLQIRQEGENYD